jgi:carbonic anhydrase/acetyltransferase-like protein (isoleucine patch superfamily)
MIYEFKGIRPNIAKSAFIAPSAEVIGDVKIGENTSIWFQTLIRGDVNYIRIGDNCNIQDMSLIHVARDVYPVNKRKIFERCSVNCNTMPE